MARTDIHRPAAIIPTEYEFVAFDYYGSALGDWQGLIGERAAFRAHMAQTGGTFSNHEHGGTCAVCGATAMSVAKFWHAKTNKYIVTGEDCAAKMHMGDPVAFRSFQKKVAAGREAVAGKRKAEAFLIGRNMPAAWAVHLGAAEGREEGIIQDIVGKLVQYGSISDAQVAFIAKLLAAIDNRAAIAAQRAAEAELAKPVPTAAERLRIAGKVITIREADPYAPFPRRKLLLQHADGWKLWGNLPAGLDDAKIGDRVEFSAKITASDRDPKFGFFSRPTKPAIVAAA